jgi:hypothetical protein
MMIKPKEKVEVESSDGDSDYDNNSVKVTKKGSTKTFTKIHFNYGCLNGSPESASVNLGKPLILMGWATPHGDTQCMRI